MELLGAINKTKFRIKLKSRTGEMDAQKETADLGGVLAPVNEIGGALSSSTCVGDNIRSP